MDFDLAPFMLIVYVAWAIVLGTIVMTWRFGYILSGRLEPDSITHGHNDHEADFYWRANRAHWNAMENLPIFASIVLVEQLVAAGTLGVFEYLAMGVVFTRIFQSVIHMLSDSKPAVVLRFLLFLAQMAMMIVMVLDLVTEDIFT